jgi:hypothetical protein
MADDHEVPKGASDAPEVTNAHGHAQSLMLRAKEVAALADAAQLATEASETMQKAAAAVSMPRVAGGSAAASGGPDTGLVNLAAAVFIGMFA